MERALRSPLYSLTSGRRRRSRMARLVRDVSWVLIISGLLLLADAGVTLLWQEPVTAVIALIERGQVDQQLLQRPAGLSAVDRRALAALPSLPQELAYMARRERRQLRTGEAVGRIQIPKIGANYVVVQGTDEASLQKGPGHYTSTALPAMRQTVAIAGHRTTYLAPFRHIDALRPGDRITLEMPYGRFVYAVQFHRIVAPTAWWVTRNVGYDRVVLSACNPLYSAAQRIVVFARLVAMTPTGAVARSRAAVS